MIQNALADEILERYGEDTIEIVLKIGKHEWEEVESMGDVYNDSYDVS